MPIPMMQASALVLAAFNLATAAYNSINSGILSATIGTTASTLVWGNNKQYLFMGSGNGANQTLFRLEMSTPGDPTTITTVTSVTLTTANTGLKIVGIKPDGLKMIVYSATDNKFYGVTLTSAWSLGGTPTVGTGVSNPNGSAAGGVICNADCTKILIACTNAPATVYELSLTSWDESTIAATGNSLNISAQITSPSAIAASSDGSKAYIASSSGGIKQYSMPNTFSMNGASYDTVTYSGTGSAAIVRGMVFSDAQTELFAHKANSRIIYQIDGSVI